MKSLIFMRNVRNIGKINAIPMRMVIVTPVRFFSNFRSLEPEVETTEKKYYRPYDPDRAEPDVDPIDF